MVENLKAFIVRMNKFGLPIPMCRDPKTGEASVSLTTVVVSFGCCVIGLSGKAAGFFGGVDLSQALTLFGISGSLYFGRRMTKNDKEIVIDNTEKSE